MVRTADPDGGCIRALGCLVYRFQPYAVRESLQGEALRFLLGSSHASGSIKRHRYIREVTIPRNVSISAT